jgi:hypothetical protein
VALAADLALGAAAEADLAPAGVLPVAAAPAAGAAAPLGASAVGAALGLPGASPAAGAAGDSGVPADGVDWACGWPGSAALALLLWLSSPQAADVRATRTEMATAFGQTDRRPDRARTRGMMRLSITTTSPFT